MRLLTKEQRNASREVQFKRLIELGYKREDYKSVVIFTNTDPSYLTLKTFYGNAANHTDYLKYRSIAELENKVVKIKENVDSREKWKAEQKEKNKGHKSSHAAAAAAIKEELSKNFPGVKFSVKSQSFSMGNSVDISWENGPTSKQVEAFSSKYQYGHFDGMTDMYESSNSRDDIPQAKYVSEHRKISKELSEQVQKQVEELNFFNFKDATWEDQPERITWRLLMSLEIPLNYLSFKVIKRERDGYGLERYIDIEFELPPTNEPLKSAEAPAMQPDTDNKIRVIDYSEKAIAVTGVTKEMTALVEAFGKNGLGGIWQPRLSCGKGWIFSKKKQDKVIEAIKNFRNETN